MAEVVKRRGVFAGLLAGAVGLAVAPKAVRAASVPRVAYHLSEAEKVAFVLGNIANHISGMGGPGSVEIVLVVHGPALQAFNASKANPDFARRLETARGSGVALEACGNTLDAQKLELADLLPGFVRLDQGGVVRLHELQMEGYAYLRP